MEEYPKYKYSYRTRRCYIKRIYVDIVSKFEYVPEKNVYRLLENRCSLSQKGLRKKCLNHNCRVLYPLGPIEISPDASDFEPQEYPID